MELDCPVNAGGKYAVITFECAVCPNVIQRAAEVAVLVEKFALRSKSIGVVLVGFVALVFSCDFNQLPALPSQVKDFPIGVQRPVRIPQRVIADVDVGRARRGYFRQQVVPAWMIYVTAVSESVSAFLDDVAAEIALS